MTSIKILHGDNRKILPKIPDNYFHSVVTDPPYELGFMGKKWDNSGIAFDKKFWAEVLRTLKPGGYLLAFAAPKLDHRIAIAIEDAGFIIKNKIFWLFGSGMPHGLNIAKAIDKQFGLKRPIVGKSNRHSGKTTNKGTIPDLVRYSNSGDFITANVSKEAQEWNGWNTELKPAAETIIMAQKPMTEKTIVKNILKWGVGCINIDACRIGTNKRVPASISKNKTRDVYGKFKGETGKETGHNPNIGRYPANVIHDGSEEVQQEFAKYGEKKSGKPGFRRKDHYTNAMAGMLNISGEQESGFGDSGSVSRFFYCAKANKHDRAGSKHPTVKPIKLIQYLVRLVTPPNGKVLDCFAGSGTTGEAAITQGFRCVLIEREDEYIKDINRRINKLQGRKKVFYFNRQRKSG